MIITIALSIFAAFLAAGIILGLLIFGVGAIGTVVLWGVKIGICAIPFMLGYFLVRALLF